MAEDDPWVIDDISEDTPAAAADSAAVEDPGLQPPAVPEPVEAGPEDHLPPVDDHYRKPVTLYKHWVRPKFLQYNYLYDYRYNYYNDVIDYLDKRNKGINTEIPRAQYWAERVLRTYNSKPSYIELSEQKRQERQLNKFTSSIKFHNYHTRAYINRKYSSVL